MSGLRSLKDLCREKTEGGCRSIKAKSVGETR